MKQAAKGLLVGLVLLTPAVHAADTRLATGGDVFIKVDTTSLSGAGITYQGATSTSSSVPSGYNIGIKVTSASDFTFSVDNSNLVTPLPGGILDGTGSAITLSREIVPGFSISVTLSNLNLLFRANDNNINTSDGWIVQGFSSDLGELTLFALQPVSGSSNLATYNGADGKLSLNFNALLSQEVNGLLQVSNVRAGSGFSNNITTISAVPEPSPLAALLLGGLVFAGVRRKFQT
jgi:hypothetical protein